MEGNKKYYLFYIKFYYRFFAKRAINAYLVPESFYDNYVPK